MLDLPQMNFSLEVMDSGQLAKNEWHPGKTEIKTTPLDYHVFPLPPFPQTWWVPAVVFGDDIIKWFVWGTEEHHLPTVTVLGLNMVALSYGCINSVCSIDLLNSFLLKSRAHTSLNNTLKKQSYWKTGHAWTDGGILTLSSHLNEHPHPWTCLQRENNRIRNSRERTKGIFIADSCRL